MVFCLLIDKNLANLPLNFRITIIFPQKSLICARKLAFPFTNVLRFVCHHDIKTSDWHVLHHCGLAFLCSPSSESPNPLGWLRLPLSRLDIVQTSLTLCSLPLNFSAFFTICRTSFGWSTSRTATCRRLARLHADVSQGYTPLSCKATHCNLAGLHIVVVVPYTS